MTESFIEVINGNLLSSKKYIWASAAGIISFVLPDP